MHTTPGFCQSLTIKVEQNSRSQPKPCGHMPGPAGAEQGSQFQLATAFESVALLPSGLPCLLPRWEGASWLHSSSTLVSTEEPVIRFTLRPLGTELTFYIWHFLKRSGMEGFSLIGSIFSSCFSSHWWLAVLVKGVFCKKPKSLCPRLGHN